MAENITIINYTPANHSTLLRLLLALQVDHFRETAPPPFLALRQDKDATAAYEDYLNLIEENTDGVWCVLLAENEVGQAIGFIIGSTTKDEALVLSNIGQLEDWFVEPRYRGQGIGIKLYNELEKWFKEKGCEQISSDTWQGNDLSIAAHKKTGFFISGIKFSKKI